MGLEIRTGLEMGFLQNHHLQVAGVNLLVVWPMLSGKGVESAILHRMWAKSQMGLASLLVVQARLCPNQREPDNFPASHLTGWEGMDNQWANLLVGRLWAQGVMWARPYS